MHHGAGILLRLARVRSVCKGFGAWSGGVSVSLLSRLRPAVVLDMAFISVGDLGSDRARSVAGRMN